MLCPSSRWADHPSRFWSHIPSHLWSVRQRMATSNQWQRVSEFPAPLRCNLHHSALSPAQLKGQLQRNPRYPSQQFVRNPDPKLVKCSPISHRPGATTTGTGACRPFAPRDPLAIHWAALDVAHAIFIRTTNTRSATVRSTHLAICHLLPYAAWKLLEAPGQKQS